MIGTGNESDTGLRHRQISWRSDSARLRVSLRICLWGGRSSSAVPTTSAVAVSSGGPPAPGTVDAAPTGAHGDHEDRVARRSRARQVGRARSLASSPRYEIVGDAGSARAGFLVIETQRPDIVLMDVALPGMDGVVATREILRRLPRTRVVILSGHAQIHDVMDAMNARAVGYVLKADAPETLTQALDRAERGLRYVAPRLAPLLTAAEGSRFDAGPLGALSEREHEVFRLAADCRNAREIAGDLCLSRKTVDVHLTHINRKLGLQNRADLVRVAAGLGFVHAIRRPPPTATNARQATRTP
jgi:DNA-binding NarL/FixJ family response regulator